MNHTLRKSMSICAAVLMLVSAGGNTLKASAKHYHHHRITRRITRKHISRYQYRRNYRYYQRLINRIKSDQKRLKKLSYYLKRHKRGRLGRNLRKHQRSILKAVRYNQRLSKRIYRNNNNFRMFAKRVTKRRAVRGRKRRSLSPAEKAAKERAYQSENAEYIKENNENVMTNNGIESASDVEQSNSAQSNKQSLVMSAASNSSDDNEPSIVNNNVTSSATASPSSVNTNSLKPADINTRASNLASEWYNDDYGKEYYIRNNESYDALSAYAKKELEAHPDANYRNGYEFVGKYGEDDIVQPTIYGLENIEASSESPEMKSANAWKFINAISSEYNLVNNYCISNANKDGIAGEGVDDNTLSEKETDYADALGHPDFVTNGNYLNTYLNSSAAANQLNSWYNQHNISPATASADANNWNARSDGVFSQLEIPANFGAYDNAAAPADNTDAGYDQALNNDAQDVEDGDPDGFNGLN